MCYEHIYTHVHTHLVCASRVCPSRVDEGGRQAGAGAGPAREGQGGGHLEGEAMRQNEDGSAADPQAFRMAVLANPQLFARLSQVCFPFISSLLLFHC